MPAHREKADVHDLMYIFKSCAFCRRMNFDTAESPKEVSRSLIFRANLDSFFGEGVIITFFPTRRNWCPRNSTCLPG